MKFYAEVCLNLSELFSCAFFIELPNKFSVKVAGWSIKSPSDLPKTLKNTYLFKDYY